VSEIDKIKKDLEASIRAAIIGKGDHQMVVMADTIDRLVIASIHRALARYDRIFRKG